MPSFLSGASQDVRFALRQLRKTPGFAIVAILTLALGVGANTAVFSVTNAVLLRYLPVRNPQELRYLHTTDFPGGQTGYGDTSMRMQVYEALRRETQVFTDLIAWVPLSTSVTTAIRIGAEPDEARGDMVSGNFFSGLGVQPVRGRLFTLDDETNHTQNVVLSYDFWSNRFARGAVLGQTLYVKGVPFTIVGVAAPGFIGVDQIPADFWVPFQTSDAVKPWGQSPSDTRGKLYGSVWWFLLTMGRLAPGVSDQQAVAKLTPIFQAAAFQDNPDAEIQRKPPNLFLSDARGLEGLRENYEQPLRLLMGMVSLVLAIACGNVAMLLVARNAARQREFSLRMALGGTRLRLFRQLLTESLLLVVSGALLGWLFAFWATQALARWSLLQHSLAPDARVLVFTIIVSVLVALLFGLAPLRSVVSVPLGIALKSTQATSYGDRAKHRAGQIVIALQMSLCMVLLIAAGLLLRTLRNVENIPLGMRSEGLLVFNVTPPRSVQTQDAVLQFYQTLLARLRALPGVESVTLAGNRLGSGWSSNTYVYVDGNKPHTADGKIGMRWNTVGPDYTHTMGIPLLMGRDLNDADTSASPNIALVNETFVKRYLAETSPLGHQIARGVPGPRTKQHTIVGVVADSKYTGVRETPRPMAFFPYTQTEGVSTMAVDVRTKGPPAAFLAPIRRAVAQFAPDVALMQPTTQREQFNDTIAQERLFARLSSFFGLLAVLLVATGLYGTLAYKVARRTAEIGVRMALGAQRGQVLWLVVRESLVLCAAGVLVGLPAAIIGARLLRSMLFGLGPGDPLTFTAALVSIVVVALAASFIPARRASAVDPMVALRCE